MPETKTCARCGKVFTIDPDWTEEKRLEEMRGNIGDIPQGERAVVCDECYQKLLPLHPDEETMGPIREAIDKGEPAPIKFNPKQGCVIKNIGPQMQTGMMLPKKMVEAINYAVGYQGFRVEMAISDWLLMWGGTTDDLVVEYGPNSSITVKHVDGRVVCHAPGIKLEVVE